MNGEYVGKGQDLGNGIVLVSVCSPLQSQQHWPIMWDVLWLNADSAESKRGKTHWPKCNVRTNQLPSLALHELVSNDQTYKCRYLFIKISQNYTSSSRGRLCLDIRYLKSRETLAVAARPSPPSFLSKRIIIIIFSWLFPSSLWDVKFGANILNHVWEKKRKKKTCGLQSAVFSLFTVSSANSSCRPSRRIVEMIQFKNIHRQTDIPSFSAFRFLGSACVPKLTQKTNSRLPFFFFFFFLHGP